MLLVLSVSGETVSLSANKNQHWVLSLTLRRWDFKKPTLGFDKPYVCARVHMCVCVCVHARAARPLNSLQFSGGFSTFGRLRFAWLDSSAKIKDLPLLPEKVTHNTPEKECVWNALRSVSCLQIHLCMGRGACRILSHSTHKVQRKNSRCSHAYNQMALYVFAFVIQHNPYTVNTRLNIIKLIHLLKQFAAFQRPALSRCSQTHYKYLSNTAWWIQHQLGCNKNHSAQMQ